MIIHTNDTTQENMQGAEYSTETEHNSLDLESFKTDSLQLDERSAYHEYRKQQDQSELIDDHTTLEPLKREPPKEPYPFVFSTYNDKLNFADLEIIKTTARFCALNGNDDIIDKIRSKYEDDPRFSFLRANHTLNSVFTDFMNQYVQILSDELGPSTQFSGHFKASLMLRAFNRAEFKDLQQELSVKMKEARDRTRLRFASYEWNKFEIQHTVKLSDGSTTLPECLNFHDIKNSILTRSNTLFDEISKESPSVIRSKKKKAMKIKAEGVTRLKRSSEQITQREAEIKCPITGTMIAESQFDKHIKILLSDPFYKDEREKFEAKHQLSNLSTSEVYENIKKLVQNEIASPLKKHKS